MTPHKLTRGTSYRIDRKFAGVGRIAIASGTDHLPTFRRILAMLAGLASIGRLDILAAIRDGIHKPLVVLHYYERGQLDRLPTAATAQGLVGALEAFQRDHVCSASYRSDLGTSVRHIKAKASKQSAVSDLPKILRDLKPSFRERQVAFNRLRAHMLSFAAETAGELSPLWLDIKRVRRFKKAEGTRVKKLMRRPLTVAEFDLVREGFRDLPVYHGKRGGGKALRRIIYAEYFAIMAEMLAWTGMRPAEYWERGDALWETRGGYIMVKGTKTAAAVRPTFLLATPSKPFCGEQVFRREFTRVTERVLGVALDVYSLRRTFASLCESAGLVESRWKAYLGHGPKTVTDIYLQTNVLPFVVADQAQVEQFMARERAKITEAPLKSPLQLTKGA